LSEVCGLLEAGAHSGSVLEGTRGEYNMVSPRASIANSKSRLVYGPPTFQGICRSLNPFLGNPFILSSRLNPFIPL
jgi:hypothetical protein